VGIIGAGQLARMTIQAAIPLDIPIRLLAASPDDGAAKVAHDVTVGSPDDPDAAAAFAAGCDVVTFDHELVPPAVLDRLDAEGVTLAPSSATMRIAQDKRRQRELFAEAGLPQPRFGIANTAVDAVTHAEAIGFPVVLKAASGGYDGRGVWVCEDRGAVERVASELAGRGIIAIVEARVAIDREHAVVVARLDSGAITAYVSVETVQADGICRELVVTADDATRELNADAERIARQVAELTGVVGVLAVELFETGGRLLVNEIATRPHNSGHWTIEGSATSQFEQHLRAVAGLPLGTADATGPVVVTANVLGPANGSDPADRLAGSLRIAGAHVHLYGKTARPGRKLGHVTVVGTSVTGCREAAWSAVEALTGEPRPEGMR
jgi:5-(carboxyamino)imidazole ribonucleotide synthase